ncbi:MAG: ABC transporter permease [Burkholderiales bacterium]|nr:ABC transporter permease [Burkholderiales bacterium]
MSVKDIVRASMYPIATGVLVILCWTAIVEIGLVPRAILPSPVEVGRAGLVELHSGRLGIHGAASINRLLSGYAIGAMIGVTLGLLLGGIRSVRAYCYFIVEVLRPIPPLGWIPLAIIWFGIGEPSKLFLIALTACFPILVATEKGVGQIPEPLVRAGRAMDLGPTALLVKVVLPNALPDITTGLRLGWTLAIAVLVGTEMIAAQSGIGFMIMDAMGVGNFALLVFGIILLGCFSIVTDAGLKYVFDQKLLRWHHNATKTFA